MSVFTALRRRPAPEPIITGDGPYRLYTNGAPARQKRFESLAKAMAAAGTSDPDDWTNSTGFNRIYSRSQAIDKVGYQQKVIEAPGLDTEFLTLQTQKHNEKRQQDLAAERERQFEERRQREENWARWNAQVAKAKEQKAAEDAKRAEEEAAKPKHVISYLTVAGQSLADRSLAVEVVTQPGYTTSTDHTETVAACKACGESHTVQWSGEGWDYRRYAEDRFDTDGRLSTPRACEWAKEHAKTCTAMPA